MHIDLTSPLIPWFIGFLGLCFGSFITLVSWRLPREESIILPRSRCPKCEHALGICDLAPIFSWLLSRGKCRHCKTPIHWRYPLIELAMAAWFLLVYWIHGPSLETGFLCLLSASLMTMLVIDFEHYIIPDSLQILIAALGLTYHLFYHQTSPATLLLAVAGGLSFGLILKYGFLYLRNKDGLGMGDVKFLAVAGCWIPLSAFAPLMLYSGLMGIATGLLWRILGAGERFPFGPALGLSLFLLLLLPEASDWFWHASRFFKASP